MVHSCTFAQVNHGAATHYLDDGGVDSVGVGLLVGSLAAVGVIPALQVAAAVEVGVVAAVVVIGTARALDVLHACTGTAVEGYVLGREGTAVADHNHRSAVDALLVGQLVVVTVVAYHLDGRTVGTGDVHRRVVNIYRIDDTQHVALLVDTVLKCLAEALHIKAGGLAYLALLVVLDVVGCVVVGVYGDALVGGYLACHRVGRSYVDGVAVGTGLHIERYLKGAARDVVLFREGLHGEHHLADIALAVHAVIHARAVEAELHVEHGRATSVEGAEEVAVAVVAVHILQRYRFHRAAIPSAGLHGVGAAGVGQLVEVGACVGAAYPAVGHTGFTRHVVGGGDGHGEAVVRGVVAVARVACAGLVRVDAGDDGEHIIGVGQQREAVAVAEGRRGGGVCGIGTVRLGGLPAYAGDVEVALLAAGDNLHLAGEGVVAAAVVHGQHILLHILQLVDDGLYVDLHLDGCHLASLFVILHHHEHHVAVEGVGERGVVGEVEAHRGFQLGVGRVVVVEHLGRAVVVHTVRAGVTVDDEVRPGLIHRHVGCCGVVVVVNRRRHVEFGVAGGGEVGVGHHHQAEGVVGCLDNLFGTLHLVGVAVVDMYPFAVGVGVLIAGVVPVLDVAEGILHVDVAGGGECAVQRRVPGRVDQVNLTVAAGHREAFAYELVVVSCLGGGHLEDCLGDAHLVRARGAGNLHRPVFVQVRGVRVCQQGGLHLAQAHLVAHLPFAVCSVACLVAAGVSPGVVGVGQLVVVAVGSPVGIDLRVACGYGAGLVDSVAAGHEAAVVLVEVAGEFHLRACRDRRLVAARGGHIAEACNAAVGGAAVLFLADIEVDTVVEDNQRVTLGGLRGRHHVFLVADVHVVAAGAAVNHQAVQLAQRHLHGVEGFSAVQARRGTLLVEAQVLHVVGCCLHLRHVVAAVVHLLHVLEREAVRHVLLAGVGGAC